MSRILLEQIEFWARRFKQRAGKDLAPFCPSAPSPLSGWGSSLQAKSHTLGHTPGTHALVAACWTQQLSAPWVLDCTSSLTLTSVHEHTGQDTHLFGSTSSFTRWAPQMELLHAVISSGPRPQSGKKLQ